MEFKTLSIRDPWAYHILIGSKNVENRVWKLPKDNINKTILIHVPKLMDNVAYEEHLETLRNDQGEWISPSELIRTYTDALKENSGKIIGALKFINCTTNNDSMWAEKSNSSNPIYNWIIDRHSVKRFLVSEYIPTNGSLGFWKYDLDESIVKKYKLND